MRLFEIENHTFALLDVEKHQILTVSKQVTCFKIRRSLKVLLKLKKKVKGIPRWLITILTITLLYTLLLNTLSVL